MDMTPPPSLARAASRAVVAANPDGIPECENSPKLPRSRSEAIDYSGHRNGSSARGSAIDHSRNTHIDFGEMSEFAAQALVDTALVHEVRIPPSLDHVRDLDVKIHAIRGRAVQRRDIWRSSLAVALKPYNYGVRKQTRTETCSPEILNRESDIV